MAIKNSLNLFKLLEDRQQDIFFKEFDSIRSNTFSWPEPNRPIPSELHCEDCAGGGYLIAFGDDELCKKCQGKGIPPIPNTELF